MSEHPPDVTVETGGTTDAGTTADAPSTDDLDPEARAAVERARAVAHVLDEAVRVPVLGVRVGIDPVLGVAPVSGDALAALGSLYIVYEGMRAGVERDLVGRMLLSIAAEFVVGSVPVVGTLVDAGWKVNVKNVERIEAHLAE